MAATRPIRVRLAPSPTGPFHVGTARTALFNWLFARQNKGAFILRIEDTDLERSEKKFEKEILEGLEWLGLTWDEGPTAASTAEVTSSKLQVPSYIGNHGPYRQSERKEIYKKYIEKLLAEGYAYYCYCTKEELEAERQVLLSQGLPPKYSGHCRNLKTPPAGKKPEVIRFKTPETKVEFKDAIRGKVSFDANLLGDMVIAKDVSTPLYNVANVIDDELMEISHVIRGEDHLSNTQKQVLFVHAFGFKEVTYAHLPLILNPDRSKMSKRFADTALLDYQNKGYLPETFVNFLALLGWHPKDNREIFSLEELIKKFDLGRVQKGGAIFNQEKLDWIQAEHLKQLDPQKITEKLMSILETKGIKPSADLVRKIVETEHARIKNLEEFAEEIQFFFSLPDYDPRLLVWQKEPSAPVKSILEEILEHLNTFSAEYPSREELSGSLEPLVAARSRGAILWPLRVALSGQTASPDPLEIISVLGLKESKNRLKTAIEKASKL